MEVTDAQIKSILSQAFQHGLHEMSHWQFEQWIKRVLKRLDYSSKRKVKEKQFRRNQR